MLRQKLSRRSTPIRRRSSLSPIHAPAAAAACSSSRPSRPAANHVTDRPHLASQSGSTPRDRKRSIPHTHRYRNPVLVIDPPRSRSAQRVLSIAFLAAHSHHSRRRGCSISFNRPHQQPNSTRRSAPLVRTHLLHRDQIPITCGTLSAQLPAGSFPGGFRTTAPVRVASSVNGPSSETLHKMRTPFPGIPANALLARNAGLERALRNQDCRTHGVLEAGLKLGPVRILAR